MSAELAADMVTSALGACVVIAATAYWTIRRAKASYGAPESQDVIDRRRQFRAAHLGKAKVAVAVTAALFLGSLAFLITTTR